MIFVAIRPTMQGYKRIFVTQEDAAEAGLIPDLEVIPSASLTALYEHFTGLHPIPLQELIKAEALHYRPRKLVEG